MNVAILAIRHSIHTIRWVNALAARGYDVTVISSHSGGARLHKDVQEYTLSISAPVGYFMNVLELRSLLRHLQPDLLHAHYASGYGTLARLSGYRPLLLSVWGSDVYDFPYRSPIHGWLLRANLRAADHICSTSKAMAEQIRSVCKGDPGPISVTPFGVDPDVFSPHPTNNRQRDVLTIGTVKTLSEKYGVDVLIRAVAGVRDKVEYTDELCTGKQLRLLIVGGGSQKEKFKQQVRDLALNDITVFTGPVPHRQVTQHLNALDIYVAVSRQESFGVAVLEASACECPVVVSDVGGLPEVVEDGHTGIIVPRENVSATANAILQLIQSPEQRKDMGKAGRRWVCNRYSWEACVDRMESVYAKLVT